MKYSGIMILLISLLSIAHASVDPIKIFPIEEYPQNIQQWLTRLSIPTDKELLTPAKQREYLQQFMSKTYDQSSPWDSQFVKKTLILDSPATDQKRALKMYRFYNQLCHTEAFEQERCFFTATFRLPDRDWYRQLLINMQLQRFSFSYNANQRGILIDNATLHKFPTTDKLFPGYKIVGGGYPFDDLIITAEWLGTPLYILHTSKDKQWYFVMTPNALGWVKARTVAHTSKEFIETWQQAIHQRTLAVIKNNIPLLNSSGHYQATAYIGTVLPAADRQHAWLPVKNLQGKAEKILVQVNTQTTSVLPLKLTPKNIANLIAKELGRPYGWGGSHFYHDCSQALKALFTPFGIWLPRHSSNQVEDSPHIDLSAKNLTERLAYLHQHGVPFKTLIYINGHVMLYIGTDPQTHHVMTFQNTWGLKASNSEYRSIIGKAVLLPLLPEYSQDLQLQSQANRAIFKIRTF